MACRDLTAHTPYPFLDAALGLGHLSIIRLFNPASFGTGSSRDIAVYLAHVTAYEGSSGVVSHEYLLGWTVSRLGSKC